MTYLLDSDVLIDFFKKKEYATQLIEDLADKKGKLAISILSVTELRSGWTNEQAKYLLPLLYDLAKVLTIDNGIVELAGQFRQEYKLKGVTLFVIDTLIAATSILKKCQLVTRNQKDFPMPKLKFYPLDK